MAAEARVGAPSTSGQDESGVGPNCPDKDSATVCIAPPSDAHNRVGQPLLDAWAAGDARTTDAAVACWRSELDPEQRIQAALLALAALDAPDALDLLSNLTQNALSSISASNAGNLAAKAADWAALATLPELRAYAVAAAARLPAADRERMAAALKARR